MASKLGVGIIGLSGGMGDTVAGHYREMEDARLVAGCGRHPERSRKASDTWGVPVYTDLAQFLAHKGLDLVVVATANFLHADQAVASIEAGKAVMLEKPMATTPADCQRIVDTANKTGGFLHVGFECRNSLLYTTVKDLIRAGELGTVVGATCMYTPGAWGSWLAEEGGWKFRAEGSGGMFCEKLCHYVDLFRFFLDDEVHEVFCAASPNVHRYYEGMVDNAQATFKFHGGGVAHLTFIHARAAKPDPDKEELYPSAGHQLDGLVLGTQATAHWSAWDKMVNVTAFDPAGQKAPWVVRKIDMSLVSAHRLFHDTATQHEDLVRRLHAGEGPAMPADQAIKTMRLCFAAEESIRTGEVVTLD